MHEEYIVFQNSFLKLIELKGTKIPPRNTPHDAQYI